MSDAPSVPEALGALAAHLRQRRSLILKSWRIAVDADPGISTANALPRNQFNDHIPAFLDAFEHRLRSGLRGETPADQRERRQDSAAHGLQRWQQGYDLREVTREWNQLQLCLLTELETYAADHPELELGVMAIARRALAESCGEGVCESTAQHFVLQRIEAEGHVRDLEQPLAQARELERQRAELWQEAAHDLRGNLGVVANATAGLTLENLPDAARGRLVTLLQRSVSGLEGILDDVTRLARLQAGQETRVVARCDAAELLKERVDTLQGLAKERGLFLRTEGPDCLPVEGDAVKVSRIAQNLLLNALRYTQEGGVTVAWGGLGPDDSDRWVLRVRDTGPGFQVGGGAPMAAALQGATQEGQTLQEVGHGSQESESGTHVPVTARPPEGSARRGEGIGLSIVKRLCEMLDASLEMESQAGVGTTVSVIFPRRYSRSPGANRGSPA